MSELVLHADNLDTLIGLLMFPLIPSARQLREVTASTSLIGQHVGENSMWVFTFPISSLVLLVFLFFESFSGQSHPLRRLWSAISDMHVNIAFLYSPFPYARLIRKAHPRSKSLWTPLRGHYPFYCSRGISKQEALSVGNHTLVAIECCLLSYTRAPTSCRASFSIVEYSISNMFYLSVYISKYTSTRVSVLQWGYSPYFLEKYFADFWFFRFSHSGRR